MTREADLYHREIQRYRSTIAKDPQAALQRYGMTLINSLDPAERATALRQWGVDITEPVDFYNLGVKCAEDENWSEAILYFKRAAEANPQLVEAMYNLAICYEKTGHTPQARSTWETYIGTLTNHAEIERLRQHVKEID